MHYKNPISLLLSILASFGFLSAPAHAAAEEGKFHLVYLVSAEKVEVGATAYVEPLFFTDGNKIVFAYGYCRQYHKRSGKPATPFFGDQDEILLPGQIGDDLTPIHQYCDGQGQVTIDAKNYAVRSNAGTELKLNRVEFTRHPLGPFLPKRGTTNVVSVQGPMPHAPEFKLAGVSQYFFLMTADKALLDRIAPMRTISEGDKARLNQRWERYRMDRFAGNPTTPPATGCTKYWATSNSERIDRDRLIRDGGSSVSAQPKNLNLIYDDLDRDGKLDLFAVVQESIRKTGMVVPISDQVVILIFYGSGKEQCVLRNHGDSMSRHTADGPVYLLHTAACSYAGMSLSTQSESVDLFSLPAESSHCKNRRVIKYDTRG